MRASPVRVYARVEADIGAVVRRYYGSRRVPEIYRLGLRLSVLEFVGLVEMVEVRLDFDPLESVLRVARRPTPDDVCVVRIAHPGILRSTTVFQNVFRRRQAGI